MAARAVNVQVVLVLVETVGIARTVGAHDADVGGVDGAAHGRGAAGKGGDLGLVLLARDAAEAPEGDVGDGQRAGMARAEAQVALAVALGDLYGVVDVVDRDVLVGDVVYTPRAAAASEERASPACQRAAWSGRGKGG